MSSPVLYVRKYYWGGVIDLACLLRSGGFEFFLIVYFLSVIVG